MYYIQHKHYSWSKWERLGTFPSKEEAKKSLDRLELLRKAKPASIDGINYYDSHAGYVYRLSSE